MIATSITSSSISTCSVPSSLTTNPIIGQSSFSANIATTRLSAPVLAQQKQSTGQHISIQNPHGNNKSFPSSILNSKQLYVTSNAVVTNNNSLLSSTGTSVSNSRTSFTSASTVTYIPKIQRYILPPSTGNTTSNISSSATVPTGSSVTAIYTSDIIPHVKQQQIQSSRSLYESTATTLQTSNLTAPNLQKSLHPPNSQYNTRIQTSLVTQTIDSSVNRSIINSNATAPPSDTKVVASISLPITSPSASSLTHGGASISPHHSIGVLNTASNIQNASMATLSIPQADASGAMLSSSRNAATSSSILTVSSSQ